MNDLPPPVLLGFECRETAVPANFLTGVPLTSVASVSRCIASPYGHREREWTWPQMNQIWLYLSTDDAWKEVPPAERAQFALYAYTVFPLTYDANQVYPFEVDIPVPAAMPPGFERLGFDVVQGDERQLSIGCSPLSCNYVAQTEPVNRWCLLDGLARAHLLARKWSGEECVEPGEYRVFEVWRQFRTQP